MELQEVALDEPVSNLLSPLQARLGASIQRAGPAAWELLVQPQPAVALAEPRAPYFACPPLALSVYGLEASLRSATLHPPLLAHLNLAREQYRELGCPLVLWLPDYALTRLAREAPDFWAWRSGVFEFAPEAEMAESALRQMVYEPGVVTSSLDAAAKRERLALLEQLLADWRELGEGPHEQDAQVDILWKVGSLHQDLGQYGAARRAHQEALGITQRLNDEQGSAGLLHNLAMLAHRQGDYAEARRLYQESLDIKQQLGNRAGVAISFHQLAVLAQDQGDYAEARRLCQESLDIEQQLGDRAGVAQTLHNLGMLAQDQGDYAEARRLYQESLAIAQQLGDRAGVAQTLFQLGRLLETDGKLDEALALYRESMQLDVELNNLPDLAIDYETVGRVLIVQGQSAEGIDLLRQSAALYERLGLAQEAQRVREQLEEQSQQFDAHRSEP